MNMSFVSSLKRVQLRPLKDHQKSSAIAAAMTATIATANLRMLHVRYWGRNAFQLQALLRHTCVPSVSIECGSCCWRTWLQVLLCLTWTTAMIAPCHYLLAPQSSAVLTPWTPITWPAPAINFSPSAIPRRGTAVVLDAIGEGGHVGIHICYPAPVPWLRLLLGLCSRIRRFQSSLRSFMPVAWHDSCFTS